MDLATVHGIITRAGIPANIVNIDGYEGVSVTDPDATPDGVARALDAGLPGWVWIARYDIAGFASRDGNGAEFIEIATDILEDGDLVLTATKLVIDDDGITTTADRIAALNDD